MPSEESSLKNSVRETNQLVSTQIRYVKGDALTIKKSAIETAENIDQITAKLENIRLDFFSDSIKQHASWMLWVGGLSFAMSSLSATLMINAPSSINLFTLTGLMTFLIIGISVILIQKARIEKDTYYSMEFMVNIANARQDHYETNYKVIIDPSDPYKHLAALRKSTAVHKLERDRIKGDLKRVRASRNDFIAEFILIGFVIGTWLFVEQNFINLMTIYLPQSHSMLIYTQLLLLIISIVIFNVFRSIPKLKSAKEANICDISVKLRAAEFHYRQSKNQIKNVQSFITAAENTARDIG